MSRKKIGIIAFAWDSLWKAIAILVATRNRQYKWIVPLLTVNSIGLLPMLYLWKFSGPQIDEDFEDYEEQAA